MCGLSTAQRGESANVISPGHAAARTSIAVRSVVVQAVPVDASALVGPEAAEGVDDKDQNLLELVGLRR